MTGKPDITHSTTSRRKLLAAAIGATFGAAVGVPLATPAIAQGDRPGRRWKSGRRAWRDVRAAVRRGEIEPLRVLKRHFEDVTGAEVIDVRYRKIDGDHLYGFKAMTRNGRLRWFAINAATREIMPMREARRRYRR